MALRLSQEEFTRGVQTYSRDMYRAARALTPCDADAQDAVAALSTMPGCAHRTAELCRQAGVRFDAVDHSTILARIIPVDAGSEQLAHAASVFAISARIAALESLQGMLRA